jgi:hypothetical protein
LHYPPSCELEGMQALRPNKNISRLTQPFTLLATSVSLLTRFSLYSGSLGASDGQRSKMHEGYSPYCRLIALNKPFIC